MKILHSNREKYIRSIIKTYKKKIWQKFLKALKEFSLINKDDHVVSGFSGGKDSIILSLCLFELARYSSVKFKLSLISLDPGFYEEDAKIFREIISDIGLDVKIYPTNLFENLKTMQNNSPCFLCSKIRRGFLYEKSKEIGANKLALGHHKDDVVETILLNIFYQSKFMTMMPKIKAKNFEDIELIRPLYYVEESYIENWVNANNVKTMPSKCYLDIKEGGKRQEVKNIIKELSRTNKSIRDAIQISAHNVVKNAIIDNTKKES